MHVKRFDYENTTRVYGDGVSQDWRIMKGDFCSEASRLKDQSPGYIEGNRRDHVRVAIPDSLLDKGLLFATLPTEQSTGLPFHINADFFPQRNRKSIVFEDTRTHDYRSEWNRAAMRAAAVAVGNNLMQLRDMFRDDAPTFWGILEQLQRVHKDQDDPRIPLGAFWEELSPSLPKLPVVYTESGKWVTPDQAHIPTSYEEKEAVSAFGALGIEIVHRDLLGYRNILTSIGVGVLRIKHIYRALQKMGMVDCLRSNNPLPSSTLELLWKGIHGVLENTQGRTNQLEAERLLKQCTLAPAVDGRLWPCGLAYRADKRTRELFAPLMSRNAASFLTVGGIPLLPRLCPQFTPDSAIKELERSEAQWRHGRFDPATLLRWFDGRNRKSRLTEDLRERLAQLPIFPSEGGYLRPGSLVYRADEPTRRLFAPLMGHDAAPFLAERVMDIPLLGELCPQFTPGSAVEELERLKAQDLQKKWREKGFDPAALLHWFDDHKRELTEDLRKRLAQLSIFPSAKNLHPLKDLRLPGGFDDPIGVAVLADMRKLGNLKSFLESLDARELTFPDYSRNYIPGAFTANSAVSREDKRKLLDILAERIGSIRDDPEVKAQLAGTHIVECAGGVFRRPGTVYLPTKDAKTVLGIYVNYALWNSESRDDLYRWLGVKDRPRAEDILQAIDKLIDQPPNQGTRKEVAGILEAVGMQWATLDNRELKNELTARQIIECTDGEFRRPAEVYFPNKEVKAILGDHVSYALQPSADRANLFCRLGVKSRPHAKDILCAIGELASRQPVQKPRKEMVNILEILGKRWAEPSFTEKERYSSLKSKAWLPAERDSNRWYSPNELYAAYSKHLFSSQAKFLDLPYRVQQAISEFLEYLGVNLNPEPFQVVSHLLQCSELNRAPPGGIYRWLNNNAQSDGLEQLRRTACLHIGGEYRYPDQVFWEQHSFGRFRVLSPDFRQYQNLVEALDIREAPDYRDAIEVLKEVAREVGDNTLSSENKDRDIVLQCWIMLSEELSKAQQSEDINAGIIRAGMVKSELHNIYCVPNSQERLRTPSEMFFEDSAVPLDELPDLSDLVRNNLIERLDRVYPAMKAAGVRSISDVVRGVVDNPVDRQEDKELEKRFRDRTRLIKFFSNSAIQTKYINFICVEELRVRWYTDSFNGNHSTQPETISAYLDRDKDTLYFTSEAGDRPWRAIARELTKATAPGEEISSNAPAIMIVLQAATNKDAVSQLKELGINTPEELRKLESTGAVVESLEEAPPSDGQQEPRTPPQGELASGEVINEAPQSERDNPAESGPMPLDDENDTPTGPSGGDGGTPTTGSSSDTETVTRGGTHGGGSSQHRRSSGDDGSTRWGGQTRDSVPNSGRRRQGSGGGRQFISGPYVGAHSGEEAPSPEGSAEADRRRALEESAIAFILKCEPDWERTPTNNPGYDLEKIDHNGVISLCEVKAMNGVWQGHRVGLTHTQFKTAQEYREAYWLYVVEHANTDSPNIVRIQDPAGKARTFTFDHGWREVAVVDDTDTESSF